MLTRHVRYVIDAPQLEQVGGTHHGYVLPFKGANDVALGLSSFPGLAAYEDYRTRRTRSKTRRRLPGRLAPCR